MPGHTDARRSPIPKRNVPVEDQKPPFHYKRMEYGALELMVISKTNENSLLDRNRTDGGPHAGDFSTRRPDG